MLILPCYFCSDLVDEDSSSTSGKSTSTSPKAANEDTDSYLSSSPWIKPECDDVLHDYEPPSADSTQSGAGPVVSCRPSVTITLPIYPPPEKAMQPPRVPTSTFGAFPIDKVSIAPVASLQIVSVSNLPALRNTFSPTSPPPSTSNCSNSLVRISCTTPTTVVPDLPNSSSGSPSVPPSEGFTVTPVEELQAETSRFTFPFGFLDDLLPENDPTRSAYIHYKCTRLRYPLSLAVAMSKLSDLSKLATVPIELPNPSGAPARRKSFSKCRRPDHGFLEIDSSHFSLNSSCPGFSSEANPPTPPTSNHPRTKAQLRSLRRSDRHPETPKERSPTPVSPVLRTTVAATCYTSRISAGRRSTIPRQRRRSTGNMPSSNPLGYHHDKIDAFAAQNKPNIALLVVAFVRHYRPIRNHMGTSSRLPLLGTLALNEVFVTGFCCYLNTNFRTVIFVLACRFFPVSADSLPPCLIRSGRRPQQQPPVIVIEDDDSPEVPASPCAPDSPMRSLNLCQNKSSFDRDFMSTLPVTISKQCLSGLSILSSQQLYEVPGSRVPYWISLKFPGDSRPRPTNYLLLGDVARIVCLLMADPSNASCLEPVLKHCCRTCHRVLVKHLKLRIPSAYVNVSALVQQKYPLGLPTGQPIYSLPVIPWPSNYPYTAALGLAWKKLPFGKGWADAVSDSLLMKTATLIMQTEPSRLGLGCTDNGTKTSVTMSSNPLSAISLPTAPKPKSKNGINDPPRPSPHLPLSIQRRFLLRDCLPQRQYQGLEQIAKCLKSITRRMFVDTKSTFEWRPLGKPRGPSVDILNTNLFTCLFDVHSTLSVCLRCLRDSYASLISAGSCLTARLKLSELLDTDVDQLRIERGRARLFPSETVARHNIVRILCEEIHPQLFNLVEQVNRTHLILRQLCNEVNLLGPFVPTQTRCSSQTYSATARALILEALGGQVPESVILTDGWADFMHLIQEIYDFLCDIVGSFTYQLSTKLLEFKSGLSMTARSISLSWIPAFGRTQKSIDARASEDLKFLAVSLQKQYDVLEAWLRAQHNVILPEIGNRLLGLFHKLFKVKDGIANSQDWVLPNVRLFVPYGSKNPSEFNSIKDLGTPFVELPSWPPTVDGLSEQSVSQNPPVTTTSPGLLTLLLTPASSAEPDNFRKVHSFRTICTTGSTPPGLVASVSSHCSPLSAESHVVCSSTSAKRICIDLSQNPEEDSTIINSCHTSVDDIDFVECTGTSTIDRRRLGQLKRKIKISHAATNDSNATQRTVSEGSDSEASANECALDGSSTDHDDGIQSVQRSPEAVETSKVQQNPLSSGDGIAVTEQTISLPTSVSSCVCENNSLEQRDSCGTQQDLAMASADKHSFLSVDTMLVSTTASPISAPLVYAGFSGSEPYSAVHSAPVFPESWTKSPGSLGKPSISSAVDPSSHLMRQSSTNASLDIEQVAANLDRLVPWLEQKTSSTHVPGPITAAVLSQSSSSLSHGCDLAIDLTSDD
ncbi:hypothetical protein T265_00966 [Opisthorchis viverrini]|uniref:Uncharacterized protein n=1 Tax=Opisthorchis viverrini TaxID=6198 RepID=A0A075AJA9_OPIVI|nr:hypothetical protein T265_00966 [Opisthorchis viverrini]KER33064.1 hypothetical protein T265_00966 [Opisthorchis viverrini]